MANSSRNSAGLAAAPRAVVGTAADLIYRVGRSVFGPLPTAQGNAWQAMQQDLERARERAELERWLDSVDSPRISARSAG